MRSNEAPVKNGHDDASPGASAEMAGNCGFALAQQ
jgi:hypothetical protein